MRLSDHTSMIVTAFCFMILMLVITAPAAPGPGEEMAPGPVTGHDVPAGSPPVRDLPLPVAGPDGTSILTLLQDSAGI